MAAHHLSRIDIEQFKTIIPNTFENPKKIKKVEFCLPLSEPDIRTERGTISYQLISMGTNVEANRSYRRRCAWRKQTKRNKDEIVTKLKVMKSETQSNETQDSSDNKVSSS